RTTEPAGLEVSIQLSEVNIEGLQRLEASLRIRPFGKERNAKAKQAQADLIPRLFQSLRSHLQSSTEQRIRQRWPFTVGLRVYPMLPSQEVAGILEGQTLNLSLSGVSFVADQEPGCEY